MQKDILRLNEDGFLLFEGFEKINNDQAVTIKIFGHRRVVIALNTPEEILECHNIITLKDKKCYDPGLIVKLTEAGLEKETSFFFSDGAYIIYFIE
jgi:hypothetical protein